MFTGRFFNAGHVLLEIADGCMLLAAAMGYGVFYMLGEQVCFAIARLLWAH